MENQDQLFNRGKADLDRAVINRKSIGLNWEVRVSWLLIGWAVAGEEEILPPVGQ